MTGRTSRASSSRRAVSNSASMCCAVSLITQRATHPIAERGLASRDPVDGLALKSHPARLLLGSDSTMLVGDHGGAQLGDLPGKR